MNVAKKFSTFQKSTEKSVRIGRLSEKYYFKTNWLKNHWNEQNIRKTVIIEKIDRKTVKFEKNVGEHMVNFGEIETNNHHNHKKCGRVS